VFETRAVGRYRLTRKLGAGAMGEVWLAHHPALKRDVAVKILKGEATGAAVQRFEREVRATAELVHPNTVRVFDYGATDEGDWFYAMEYVPGETLATAVRRDGPMDAARVARLALQAARALGEAHGRGIIHRDIKPENIMLTAVGAETDFVKVLDFGVAQVARDHETHVTASLTRDGAVVGTPLYMSPEQGQGDAVDARSDLYALGCVMYFALCGSAPFDTGNSTTTILMHMTKPPPAFEERGVTVPDALRAVVLRCLAKDPAERFPDAASLAAALIPLGAA
jgi:serine/threonine-protein kinase